MPARPLSCAILLLSVAAACAAVTDGATPEQFSDAPLSGTAGEVHVLGLSCPLCSSNLDLVLARVPGVASAEVDLERGIAHVTFAPGRTPSARALAQAVVDAGFTVLRVEAQP